jgi:hypothetical protein
MPAGTKAAYAGLVRNVELPDDPTWPTAEDQINDFTSIADANSKYGPLRGNAQRPYVMHLSEGTDQSAHDVFEFLKQADGSPLIAKNFIGVHATGLDANQYQAMRTRRRCLVSTQQLPPLWRNYQGRCSGRGRRAHRARLRLGPQRDKESLGRTQNCKDRQCPHGRLIH